MITFVNDYNGEWLGVYIDGRVVFQGHSIYPTMLLNLLEIEYESIEGDAEATGNQFPSILEDVVKFD